MAENHDRHVVNGDDERAACRGGIMPTTRTSGRAYATTARSRRAPPYPRTTATADPLEVPRS